MERDETPHKKRGVGWNFNSHAHVERDTVPTGAKLMSVISTHTLTWSVTFSRDISFIYHGISTHTLTWSVTEFVCKKCHDNFISTHTLTWSVTLNSP